MPKGKKNEEGEKRKNEKTTGQQNLSQTHCTAWLPSQSPPLEGSAAPGPQPSQDPGLPLTHRDIPGAGETVTMLDTKQKQKQTW